MIGKFSHLLDPRLRLQAGIEKSQTPVKKGCTCPMGEKKNLSNSQNYTSDLHMWDSYGERERELIAE